MKKTITIHIKGVQFYIEEAAYEKLENYILRLEQKLGSTEGKNDIIEDIELRIAEILSEALGNDLQKVVEQVHIEDAIAHIGEPEDYIDGQEEGKTEPLYPESGPTARKLFRDMENASVAGVCAGLAAYFNIDVMLIRIAVVLIVIFGGFGIPLYIILWIVIPRAQTHVDRLKMKGRPINLETVREEVESAAQKMADRTSRFNRNMNRDQHIKNGFSAIGRLVRIFFGIFLLFVGLGSFVAFMTFVLFPINLFPIGSEAGLYSLYGFTALLWENTLDLNLLWYLGGSLVAVHIGFILIVGIKWIFNLHWPWFKYFSRATIACTIFSVILGFYLGTKLATSFAFEGEETRSLNIDSNELHVFMKQDQENFKEKGFTIQTKKTNHLWMHEENKSLYQEINDLRCERSPDSSFHLLIKAEANGSNRKTASRNAGNISFLVDFHNDTLNLPGSFSFPVSNLYRGQNIDVILQIPRNKKVFLNGKAFNVNERNWEYSEDNQYRHVYFDMHGDFEVYD